MDDYRREKRYYVLKHIQRTTELQSALENLYNNYKIPLLKMINRFVGSSSDCEDIFHEVFIRIIKNAEMIINLPQQKQAAYIYLIARGVSIDYLRNSHANDRVNLDYDAFIDLLDKKAKSSSCNSFHKVDLSLMLDDLSENEKNLLIGKYYLGLSTNELTDLVGGTPVAIRSKLLRAKEKVFQAWSQAGISMEDFLDEREK